MNDVQMRTKSLRRRNRRRGVVSPATDDDHNEVETTLDDSHSALFFFPSTASEDGDECRSSETLVAGLGDSADGSTISDDFLSTAKTPLVQGSSAMDRESVVVPRRPHSVCADKNCSTRAAIVRTSQISALVASRNFRWSDTQLVNHNQQPADADHPERDSPSPTVSRARSARFRRVFPDVSDAIINSFHCAYVGEVLFQGILYVTGNFFCFHSKLLGSKKAIKIPVSSVTDIAKMNTAMIIPNAVGIFTADNKYVFGSLISRRNTFQLLLDVWKQSNDTEAPPQRNGDMFDMVNNNKKGTLSERTSSSKSVEDLRSSNESNSDGDDDDDGASTAINSHLKSAVSPNSRASPPTTKVDGKDGGDYHPQLNSVDGPSRCRTDGSTDQAVLSATSEASKHRTGRWLVMYLILFTAIVVMLTFTAVYHAYKVIHLQSLVDAYANVIAIDAKFADTIHRDAEMYRLRHDEHLSLVKRLRSSIEAHVRLLTKVNESLKTLCKLAVESQESSHSQVVDADQQLRR